ncbi:hypothetical protein BU23DRAFT_604254 [Bimuria novae-zelandiae CBS 107.79]|uniref:Uncharacterized protein n=1 Tax=Bimuria novae-zelandiae CBS 107.79 TaxID=1447943 RepID=A0A6A5UN34_9PLEO|nr:hypothetical protein BU23DRAFT_604254 [Bimuria novae-zelandiae CBS 107.79]
MILICSSDDRFASSHSPQANFRLPTLLRFLRARLHQPATLRATHDNDEQRGFSAEKLAAWAVKKFPDAFQLFCIKFPIEERIFVPHTPFVHVAGLVSSLNLHCDVLLCIGQRNHSLDTRRWTGRFYAALRKDFSIDFVTRDSENGSFRLLRPRDFGTTYKLTQHFADVFSLEQNVDFARMLRNACMYCFLKAGHVSGFYSSVHIKVNLFGKMCRGLAQLYSIGGIEDDVNDIVRAAAETGLVDRNEEKDNSVSARKLQREEAKARILLKKKNDTQKREHGEQVNILRKEVARWKELYETESKLREQAEKRAQRLEKGYSGTDGDPRQSFANSFRMYGSLRESKSNLARDPQMNSGNHGVHAAYFQSGACIDTMHECATALLEQDTLHPSNTISCSIIFM